MQKQTLDDDGLQWLACPVCHEGLKLDGDAVVCVGCARRFPVEDGIAVLLEGRAEGQANTQN